MILLCTLFSIDIFFTRFNKFIRDNFILFKYFKSDISYNSYDLLNLSLILFITFVNSLISLDGFIFISNVIKSIELCI